MAGVGSPLSVDHVHLSRVLGVSALLTAGLTGCGTPGASITAQGIAASVRSLPGVAQVDNDYTNSFTHGENFVLTVELDAAATQTQAQQVARTFTEGAVAADFREAYYVVLTIRIDRGIVTLRPLVGDGAMTPADTDAQVAALYAALASPAVESATVVEPHPADGTEGDVVTLRQPVDIGAAEELLRTAPSLADTAWRLTGESVQTHLFTTSYTSDVIPDAVTQQVWTEVVRLAAPADVVGRYEQGVTTFNVYRGAAGGEALLPVRDPLVGALNQLGRPVELRLGDGVDRIDINVGG